MALDQKIEALRRFTRFFGQRLGPMEAGPAGSSYSATEVRVLGELALADQRTVTALSRSLGLDAGYLSRVIRRLETIGVVTRSADSSDSRQQPLSLTGAGRVEVATLETITRARYAALVRTLPAHVHGPVLDAMERIESAFGTDVPARDAAPYVLRPHRAGDISYVAQRAIASMMEEFELGATQEQSLLNIGAQFLASFDAARDCAWIAEREGAIVGSVLVQQLDEASAVLRLLHVESRARGIGIGRRLIAEAVDFAKRAGYACVQIELLDELKTARQLVHAAGFRHAGEYSDVVGGSAVSRQVWELPLQTIS